MTAICEIININVDFRIFVNASHSVFLKKYENTNKIKTKFFFEIAKTLLSRMLCYGHVPKFREKY